MIGGARLCGERGVILKAKPIEWRPLEPLLLVEPTVRPVRCPVSRSDAHGCIDIAHHRGRHSCDCGWMWSDNGPTVS